MSNYQLRELPIGSHLIGVRFKSEKFGCLANLPLNETKNLRIELSEIMAPSAINTLNQLADLENITEKIRFLEDYKEKSFQKNLLHQDKMVGSVAQSIRTLQGVVNVKELAESHHICLRQLERRFKSYVGLTLKEFSNIERFQHAKTSISTLAKTSLLEIAFDFGFHDHSHMTNEFKRLSGEIPSFFR
jgi:transcriptional regulator GlxA family with amidase domain